MDEVGVNGISARDAALKFTFVIYVVLVFREIALCGVISSEINYSLLCIRHNLPLLPVI